MAGQDRQQGEKGDINTLEDVKLLVDTFYGRARQDELVGPIFNDTIQDRWPEHLAKLYAFWSTILLDARSYHGRPFVPHFPLPIAEEHFNRWLQLFHGTLDDFFQGPRTEEARMRSVMMARMFLFKITEYREAGLTPIQ
ncbi:MAG TPA: group III truncated hemoglobin [Flavobacteriales bacterium]|nr:group III truncated hemoglobin [Flavobacteriales bacterium]